MMYPNWFEQTAQDNFEIHLSHFADEPHLNFLQIGAFTGDASVWMLENVLTNKSSFLTDVDTWLGSDEQVHAEMDFKEVHDLYLARTGYANRLWHKGKSVDFLSGCQDQTYDFIYIDGDHTASGVIDDAIMAWPLLKPGGIMAFDDYTWTHEHGALYEPKPSINFFCWVKQLELEVITSNSQVWIRKL